MIEITTLGMICRLMPRLPELGPDGERLAALLGQALVGEPLTIGLPTSAHGRRLLRDALLHHLAAPVGSARARAEQLRREVPRRPGLRAGATEREVLLAVLARLGVPSGRQIRRVWDMDPPYGGVKCPTDSTTLTITGRGSSRWPGDPR